MSKYINEPKTLEEFVGNARFQLENTEGYLLMQRDRGGDLEAVHIKATCLLRAAELLVAAAEAEMRIRQSAVTEI